jgi:uncharacterized membrane protein YeaQ/YmgE (transglycosylase-associated protein family)
LSLNISTFHAPWLTPLLTSIASGLILCFLLLRFKPQLSGKIGPVFWLWLLGGVALAVLARVSPSGPPGSQALLVTLPIGIVGAFIGRYLARNLQPAGSNGFLIGIVSFAVPAFFGQIANYALRDAAVMNETRGLMGIFLTLLTGFSEFILILWFIRDWGRPNAP